MQEDHLRTLLRNGILTSLIASGISGCDGSTQAPSAALGSSRGTAGLEDPSGSAAAEQIAAALDERDPFIRSRQLASLLPTLDATAVPAIRAVLTDPGRDLDPSAFDLLLRAWTRLDAEAAAGWAFQKAPPVYRLSAVRTAVETWAEADPASALVGVDSALIGLAALDRQLVPIAEHAFIRGWFRKDRGETERFVEGLGSGVKRQRSLMAFVLSLAYADGSEAAIRFAEGVPETDERYKTEVYQQTLSALSLVSMPAAVEFCDAHCDDRRASGLRGLLSRTRLRNGEDGGRVLEWVARTESGEAIRQRPDDVRALRSTYAIWARLDRDSALAWMRGQLDAHEPPGWIDLLMGEYARQIAIDSPAEAIRMAEQVPDAIEREQSLVRIGRYWIREDEEKAEGWLERSNLSDTLKAQVRDRTAPIYLPNITEEAAQEG